MKQPARGPILSTTLSDGFRILLFAADMDPARGVCRYVWRLFDGGRFQYAGIDTTSYAGVPDAFAAEMRKVFLRVLAPPHVLVTTGYACTQMLNQFILPAFRAEMRILDLRLTASLLLDPTSPGKPWNELMQAYEVAGLEGEDAQLLDRQEALLWAVLDKADAQGLEWPQLLSLSESTRPSVSFDSYAFDEAHLAQLPPTPAVYEMFDSRGTLLYVGKAGNLSERLGSYFQPTRKLSPKLTRIRERVHSFAYHTVGSELEALLVENERIQSLEPEFNVQRKIVEGTSRYGQLRGTTLIVMPSVRPERVELFFAGGSRASAVQISIDTRRPPRATLTKVCAWYGRFAPRLKRTRAVRNWGSAGNEICSRFFHAHRQRLHWCELPPGPADSACIDTLLEVVARAHKQGFDPAEVRF